MEPWRRRQQRQSPVPAAGAIRSRGGDGGGDNQRHGGYDGSTGPGRRPQQKNATAPAAGSIGSGSAVGGRDEQSPRRSDRKRLAPATRTSSSRVQLPRSASFTGRSWAGGQVGAPTRARRWRPRWRQQPRWPRRPPPHPPRRRLRWRRRRRRWQRRPGAAVVAAVVAVATALTAAAAVRRWWRRPLSRRL